MQSVRPEDKLSTDIGELGDGKLQIECVHISPSLFRLDSALPVNLSQLVVQPPLESGEVQQFESAGSSIIISP